ncbi:MAG: hypothetical protein K0S39_5603 [Paenibacillus sp.]|nr:hypothetical protein [Paenibacillus sp.]
MTDARCPISEKLKYYKTLSSIEKCVLDIIIDHEINSVELDTTARMCQITEVQAALAVQLLKYKGLIVQ